jgi:hypothetical protein
MARARDGRRLGRRFEFLLHFLSESSHQRIETFPGFERKLQTFTRFGPGQVRLVPDHKVGPLKCCSLCCSPVLQQNHQLGGLRAGERAADPLAFDGVGCLPQTCGIGKRDQISPQIQVYLNDVAGGSGDFRNDGDVSSRQRIHQRTFTSVRISDHR